MTRGGCFSQVEYEETYNGEVDTRLEMSRWWYSHIIGCWVFARFRRNSDGEWASLPQAELVSFEDPVFRVSGLLQLVHDEEGGAAIGRQWLYDLVSGFNREVRFGEHTDSDTSEDVDDEPVDDLTSLMELLEPFFKQTFGDYCALATTGEAASSDPWRLVMFWFVGNSAEDKRAFDLACKLPQIFGMAVAR